MRSGFINHGTTFGHKSIVYDSTYFCLCCSKLEILIKLDNLHKVSKYFNEPNRHQTQARKRSCGNHMAANNVKMT